MMQAIQMRTLVFGAVFLIVGVVLLSEVFSRQVDCGSASRGGITARAVNARRGSGSPCGIGNESRETRQIEIGLLFLSGLAAAGCLAADVNAWRNAGWDD